MGIKSNVSVGKPKAQGALFRAPANTSIPRDANTALSAAFKPLGYVSKDGLKNSNKKTSDFIRAWGGDIVEVLNKEHTDSFVMTLIESLNTEVLKASHGDDNVFGTLEEGITVRVNADEDEAHVYVAEIVLKKGLKKRIVIPEGIVTEVGDVVYKDDDVISYPITLTALPDDEGQTHYEYIGSAST